MEEEEEIIIVSQEMIEKMESQEILKQLDEKRLSATSFLMGLKELVKRLYRRNDGK